MPQMMPINWIISFIMFILMFILFNILNYYIISNYSNKKALYTSSSLFYSQSYKKNWKW